MYQGCVILRKINIDDASLEGRIWKGCDFSPGFGHGAGDREMRGIQSLQTPA